MIPNVYGQGHASKIVETLVETITNELGEKKSPLQHQIGTLILLDRDVDYVTPLCSQVRAGAGFHDTKPKIGENL